MEQPPDQSLPGGNNGQHEHADGALHISESTYRTLFHAIDEGFCIFELLFDNGGTAVDGIYLEANSAFEQQTGYLNPIGQHISHFQPDLERTWFEQFADVARTGKAVRFIQYTAGMQLWYDVYALRVGAAGDNHIALLFTNITARKQTEATLHTYEERFRLFVTTVSEIVYRMSADWHEMYALEGKGVLVDTSKPSQIWLEGYIPDSDKTVVQTAIDTAIHTKTPFELEHRVIRADGTIGWVFSRAIPFLDVNGNIIEWFGAASDITERKRTETALHDAYTLLEERVRARTAALAEANEERQALLQRVIAVQEDEQQRISRELHDSLGQLLSALTVRLTTLLATVAHLPEIQASLSNIQAIARDIDHELDRLALDLRPPTLNDFGLSEALHTYSTEWTQSSGVPVDLVIQGRGDERLPILLETNVYRIIQEALTNTLKYAQATTVSIILRWQTAQLQIIIEDNGVGFDYEAVQHNRQGGRQLGLLGMRERATLMGGTLTIESEPGSGTTIYLTISLEQDRTPPA